MERSQARKSMYVGPRPAGREHERVRDWAQSRHSLPTVGFPALPAPGAITGLGPSGGRVPMNSEYRGERCMGGQLVYTPDGDLLDRHLHVLRRVPGGFDWGSETDEARIDQLAIALLADSSTKNIALEHYTSKLQVVSNIFYAARSIASFRFRQQITPFMPRNFNAVM
nr:DUF6166 domain-containing protein [Halobacterium salinarum]